jgi:hypothetical protein
MGLSFWIARARGILDMRIAAVAFTKPEKDLRLMDVATGPCVPLEGHTRPVVGPFGQAQGFRPQDTAALLPALTGEPADGALEVIARRGRGVLHVCTARFVNALADANAELIRLADEDEAAGQGKDLPRFVAKSREYDDAWRAFTEWPARVPSLLERDPAITGWAAKARERGHRLHCWHGPSVPMVRLVSGDGPYPGRGA